MQTKNPLLDDLSRLMTGAVGAAQSMGEEARGIWRAQADRIISEMDLMTREEGEALKALARDALARVEVLEARLAALETGAGPAQIKPAPAKPAPAKPAPAKPARKKPSPKT
jgi:BMFP domain-containing protein YqiC